MGRRGTREKIYKDPVFHKRFIMSTEITSVEIPRRHSDLWTMIFCLKMLPRLTKTMRGIVRTAWSTASSLSGSVTPSLCFC